MTFADISAQAMNAGREIIKDGGPHYHEFHAEAFIKEPWNALSSLFFLVPVFFWLWKLRGQYKHYLVITLLLPFLFMNGVGSTLYHAFRASQLALLLDWVPAQLMNMVLSWYLWKKVVKKGWIAAAVMVGFYTSAITLVISLFPVIGEMAGNLGYFFIGMAFLLPAIIYMIRTDFYKWQYFASGVLFLGIALLFRSLDHPTPNPFPGLMPQGTHFLWHISSALAVFPLGFYMKFIIDRKDI